MADGWMGSQSPELLDGRNLAVAVEQFSVPASIVSMNPKALIDEIFWVNSVCLWIASRGGVLSHPVSL